MTEPLITPKTLRSYSLPEELSDCDCAFIGFFTFTKEIESKLKHIGTNIVSHHDDRRQFFGEYKGKKYLALDRVFGGVVIANVIEELVHLHGIKKIIGLGWSGTFIEDLNVGDFVIADSAVNTGGVSREYCPNDNLLNCDDAMLSAYRDLVEKNKIPFKTACAWTTEAIYCEYPEDISRWIEGGGEIINMETSFLYSVCKRLGIPAIYACVISDLAYKKKWEPNFAVANNKAHILFDLLTEVFPSKELYNKRLKTAAEDGAAWPRR